MASDNIFEQNPAPAVPPPSGAQPAAQANVPPPSGTPVPAAAQASNTPANAKRNRKIPLNGIAAVLVLGVLVLGVFGLTLPTDSVAQIIGEATVSAASNSLTTLGYALVLMMIASAVVGNALGRARNK